MNRNKIILTFLPIIIICLLLAGYFASKNSSGENMKDNHSDEGAPMMSDEVYNELKDKTNNSEKLLEKHCLDDLCVNSIKVSVAPNMGIMQFELQNIGSQTLPAGFVKMVCKNDSSKVYYIYHNAMKPNEIALFQYQFTDKSPYEIDDYVLMELSPKELKEREASLRY